MLFYMVLGRIDIAAAERATEFSHSLLESCNRDMPAACADSDGVTRPPNRRFPPEAAVAGTSGGNHRVRLVADDQAEALPRAGASF